MAISTVTLYKVGFRPETNPCLDSISTYLASLTPVLTINNFQFVKHALDLTIKCEIYQSELASPSMNYLSIKNDIDSRTYYYYIRNVYWRSQNTLLLDLSMDTLNTFKDLILFTNNTIIRREHKDRFIQKAVGTGEFFATRIIDKIDEGLTGLVKYNDNISTISSSMKKWYLVYCTNQGTNVGDTASNVAINCYLIPESDSNVTIPGGNYTLVDIVTTRPPDANHNYARIFTSESVSININGTIYSNDTSYFYGINRYRDNTYSVIKYNRNTGYASFLTGSWSGTDTIIFSGPCNATGEYLYDFTDPYGFTWDHFDIYKQDAMTYLATGTYTLKSIANVNRTLSYLVKIIECPYPPVDINSAIADGSIIISYTDELSSSRIYALKLAILETNFKYKIYTSYNLSQFLCTIPSLANRLTASKNITYESKMYHSSIFSRIMTYDSFTLELPCEEFSGLVNDTPSVDIYYKQSNAINSALYFDFQVNRGTWIKTEALENILMCNRNNEYPIYNSSYLDYIRTGYNFDKKAKTMQARQNWTNVGLNALGTGLSFGLSSATKGISVASGVSMLTSGISSISNAIYSNINMRNQIEQKKAEAKATASSVQASDDLNLLNGYLGNKLFAFTYSPSDNVKSKIFELFYLTGYACEESGIPNTTSRYRFNYLQCEAEFSTRDNPVWRNFIEDVKERFRLGVTFFHKYNDFEQTLENWESWMITE